MTIVSSRPRLHSMVSIAPTSIVITIITILSAQPSLATGAAGNETSWPPPAVDQGLPEQEQEVPAGTPPPSSGPGDAGNATLYDVVVVPHTFHQAWQVRRLGVPAIGPGTVMHRGDSALLEALRDAGVPFHVTGGTTSFAVAPVSIHETGAGTPSVAYEVRSANPPNDTGTITLGSGVLDEPIPDNNGSWVGYRLRNATAPSGAEVTDLRYRTRISDEGNGSFYCGDFEIYLFSGDFAWEHLVYDNLGGYTDGGWDDDSADDSDIYLNWRSTSYFNGEDPNQWWGIRVIDNLSSDEGKLDYIEFQVDWESPSVDGFEPDDSAGQAWLHPHNSTSGPRSISPVGDQDWIRIELAARSEVIVETVGLAGDTRLWLYDGSVTQIDFDDDGGTELFSRIARTGAGSLDAGTYYAKVDEYGNDEVIEDYGIELTVNAAGVPDLTSPSVSFTSYSVTEGDPFTIAPLVKNEGEGWAGASHARVFLSIDDDFDTSDDHEITPEKSVSTLAPQETDQPSWSFTFPDLRDLSTYSAWIVTVVDSQSEVAESDEVNTYKGVDPITVTNYVAGTPEIEITPLLLQFDSSSIQSAVKVAGAARPNAAAHPDGTSRSRSSPAELRRLRRLVERQGRVPVIVDLALPFTPEGRLPDHAAARQRERIREAQSQVLRSLQGTGAEVTARFRFVPALALEIGAEALDALERHPLVAGAVEDRPVPPTMASSNPVIGADVAWSRGYLGTGQTVAILDTGVDKAHAYFTTGGNKVVSEACYSANANTSTVSSFCPGGASSSTADGSGTFCPTTVNGCRHGTHVAGSAAGDDASGPNLGVARGSDVIAIQVFSRFEEAAACSPNPAPCARSYFSDQIEGLERVYALRTTYDIAAANMSLGGGRYTSEANCDAAYPSVKAAIDNLRSVGIATVISAGNDDYVDALGTPACISSAVSVGATTDSDDVAWFSNVADFLDLFAPGVSITSSVPGGGTGTWNGTSMAAPHVTGAFAVLKAAHPTATVDDVLGALRSTGTLVDDGRTGGTVVDIPRINLDLALDALGGGTSQGSFTISNTGNATLTVSSIALASSASWISWSPQAPFDVAPGGAQVVDVTVDFAQAPDGQTTRRLLVESNDSDESPYPGGVYVEVTKQTGGGCAFATDLDLANQTMNGNELYRACRSISAGPGVSIVAPGNVVFEAGERVILNDGFSVGSGASFKVVIDPSLASP